jgi:hypothetical protein
MQSRRCVFRSLAGFLAFMGGCSNAAKQEAQDPPVVVAGVRCEHPTWFVGLIDPQKQRNNSHSFTLQNETDQTIPISEIKADCGCVVAEHQPKEIPAHASAAIDVSYRTSPAPGEFNHAVLIKLGAAETADLFLKIRGTIIPSPALHANPPSLDFGRVMYNETKTQTFVVSRYDFSRVGIVSLNSGLKGCTLESQPAKDSEAMLVSVTVDAAALGAGSHSKTVHVETDHSSSPSLEVPIQVDVGGLADLFRSTLLVDSIPPGGYQDFSPFGSRLPSAIPPMVAGIEFKGDSEIEVQPCASPATRDAGQKWRLLVSPKAKIGVVKKGVLRISVSSGVSDAIEVPVIVFVK